MQISTMQRQNSDGKSRWKAGLQKLRRQSTISEFSAAGEPTSPSLMDEDPTEAEMQDYFAKLKKRTGLNQLWSGRKFEQTIDKDPDIDLSEEPKLRSSTLKELTLDSDEEDLRNFIHNLSDGEQSHISEEEEQSQTASSKSEVDLMKNINFAELGPSAYQMPDIESDDDKDYMPRVLRQNPKEDSQINESQDDSEYSHGNIFKNTNINFVSSEVSSVRILDKLTKHSKEKGIDSDINETLSEMSEEIPEVHDASRVNTPATLIKSNDYTASKFESYSDEESSRTQSNGNSKTIRENKIERTKSRDRSSRTSVSRSSNTSRSSSSTSSRKSYSDKPSKGKSKKEKDRKSSRSSLETTSVSSNSSESKTSSYSKSKTKSSSSSVSSSTEQSYHKHKSKLKKTHDKKDRYKQGDLKIGIKDIAVIEQAMLQNQMASKYLDPSPIAATVVSDEALEAVAAYNPTMLALNDLLKYQLQLTRQHIDNSWRLYHAYAEPEAVGTHKYTTLKQTLKYIKKHGPSVISYEDALKQIQNGEDF